MSGEGQEGAATKAADPGAGADTVAPTVTEAVVAADSRDARAARRDDDAERRDMRAAARDVRAHARGDAQGDGFADRFLAAGDRDDAAGDRAEALGDRAKARKDRLHAEEERLSGLPTAGVSADWGEDFQRALEERSLVGLAQGLLMATMHVSAEDAFEELLQQSQHRDLDLAVIAAELVDRHQPRGADRT